MGRKSLREHRRKEIVEAFYLAAKEGGLHNISIGKLAQKMGVNPSLIIHYFSSKEELVFGLIEFILDRYKNMYMTGLPEGKSAIIIFHEIVDNLFSGKWGKLVDDDVYYNCYTLIFRNGLIKERFRTLHDSLRQMLAEIIEQCRIEGYIATENAYEQADFIFLFLDGAYYYRSMTDDPVAYDRKMSDYKNKILALMDFPKAEV